MAETTVYAYFYRDSDPQKIRNNFHADLIFADLKYTFKIWVISREIRPLAALYPPPYKKSAL